jgi:uncharacterized protein (TIGR02118 family)
MVTAESGVMIARRTGLALGLAAATASVLAKMARADGTKDTVKLTVLYGAPKDPAAFESHYAQTHMPMIHAVKDIRVEVAKPLPSPDGKPPAYYRITEIWFPSLDEMHRITSTPEWKQIAADVPNFASGGATFLVSMVE